MGGRITGNATAIYASTINLTNEGLIEATADLSPGMVGVGTAIHGDAVTVTNSGTIRENGAAGHAIGAVGDIGSATVNNLVGGTIQANGTNGVSDAINANTVNLIGNDGRIEATGADGRAINGNTITALNGAGTITAGRYAINGISVTLSGNNGLIEATGAGGNAIYAYTDASVTNSKTIQALAAGGTAINAGGKATVHNLAGGAIAGGTSAIVAATLDVTNDDGASISGGANAIEGSGTVRNAGTISGGTASVAFNGASGTNTLILQTGSKLIGDAVGSAAGASNALVLEGRGVADNNFIGFNSLVMSGDAWGLNGSAEVGTASLNSGILTVGDGSHRDATLIGDVTLNSGAILAGFGTIAGDVNVANGGNLAPGSSIGTLTVTGNASFAPGAIFTINVSPHSASKLAVAGTAILTGGTVQVLAGGTGFAPSTQYTILTATGGLGGTTFGDVTSDLAFLTPTLSYDPNDVFLTLDVNATAFPSVAITPNQRAVAVALAQSPTDSALVAAVLGQNAEGARQAFDALSGEVFASVHTVQAEDALLVRRAILDRLRAAAYDDAPAALRPLGYGGPALAYNTNEAASGDYASGASNDASGASGGHDASAPSPRLGGEGRGEGAYAADMAPPAQLPLKAPLLIPPRAPTYSFWAQGFGAWGHVDLDGNAAALKDNFAGFIAGVDTRLGSLWRAGLTAGYTHADLSVDARHSSGNIDSGVIGLYAGGPIAGRFNVRLGGTYTFDNIDTNRSIIFPGFFDATHASFNGHAAQVFAELGYGMSFGRLAVEPLAGLAYVNVHTGGFAESDDTTVDLAALNVASGTENTGYSTLGLRLATLLPLSNGAILTPHLTAQWQHAFGDVSPSAALAFQSTGIAFDVAGVPIARNAGLIDAGLDWRVTPQAKLGVSYWGDLASDAQVHAVKGSFTWDW